MRPPLTLTLVTADPAIAEYPAQAVMVGSN